MSKIALRIVAIAALVRRERFDFMSLLNKTGWLAAEKLPQTQKWDMAATCRHFLSQGRRPIDEPAVSPGPGLPPLLFQVLDVLFACAAAPRRALGLL
jgi:hypothetical protein